MINLNQLRCFWAVARAGGIHRASEQVHLTPQTLSGQISKLEETLGLPLFERTGRQLRLTDTGRMALSYADDIFQASTELENVLRQRPGHGRRPLFRVGIADVVPKSVTYSLLAPALATENPVRLVCREDKLTRLLGDLAIHELDLVIADAPHPPGLDVKCYSHALGSSGVAFLARRTPGTRRRPGKTAFPQILDGMPMLLPGLDSALRGPLLRWLSDAGVHPVITGEFEDGALMKAFGRAGAGVFPVPAAIAHEVCAQYGVEEIGRTDALREQFYAITAERRLSHPASLAVIEAARGGLFAAGR